jgi:hypothetical protein
MSKLQCFAVIWIRIVFCVFPYFTCVQHDNAETVSTTGYRPIPLCCLLLTFASDMVFQDN